MTRRRNDNTKYSNYKICVIYKYVNNNHGPHLDSIIQYSPLFLCNLLSRQKGLFSKTLCCASDIKDYSICLNATGVQRCNLTQELFDAILVISCI